VIRSYSIQLTKFTKARKVRTGLKACQSFWLLFLDRNKVLRVMNAIEAIRPVRYGPKGDRNERGR